MSCNRCKGTSSDPRNFLLCCSGCGKNWHHRCHIPPLSDPELITLLRATNNNDVDNGLSSWIGKCCRKKRTRAQATPEASVISAPSATVSQQGTSSLPTPKRSTSHLDQALLSNGTATPPKQDDGFATGELSFHNPAARAATPALQYPQTRPESTPLPPNIAIKDGPSLHSTPPPSTSSSTRLAPPSFNNVPSSFVPYSRPSHLQESSLAFERMPTSQLVDAPGPSQSRKPSSIVGGPSHNPTNSTSMDVDPPTLDLRALSLNRAHGPSKAPSRLLFHRVTTTRDPSPPPLPTPPPVLPSVKSEDDYMEDLYAPVIRHTSPHIQPPSHRENPHTLPPSPSLEYPEDSEPPVLPALAAKDPRILGILERHERREAERPRQGMRKVQAVRGAGKMRGKVALVANRTQAERAQTAEVSRRAITRSHQCIISFLKNVER